ncbi:hypothetical protein BGW38_000734 [Lunasporangiospora selenospora]|uniref:Ras guanine nucleotide exchange factor domain-containing protein n=1 Tax=Lunasporangiospora selenospora TaxID=979761 RepID=A0A9P6FV93_9FUNG|nr:hypothetical protein BGW38_000734 [Lunasporangiospora selenospora]
MMAQSPPFVDFIVRALHEYQTDSDGHLSFAQLQYIKVKHCEESGWWFGESESSRGWFPSNRVERVAPAYESEITSEDYDQIRTGLDNVETQFLGEPDPVPDTSYDWRTSSPSSGRCRAGELAFPPSQLSSLRQSLEEHYTDRSDDALAYTHSQGTGNTGAMSESEVAYAYSDFVSEVEVCVGDIREAMESGDTKAFKSIVANIFLRVRMLLIFTNTVTRDSEVLQAYPELARSRRTILRALGKMDSKRRIADGSQTPTTIRQRRLAAERLIMFAMQVLGGITYFTTHAHEIGLCMRTEDIPFDHPDGGSADLDMLLIASNEAETVVHSPPSYPRPRRRVSRANSAKSFKSFNAVRHWKMEHAQRFNTAKMAVEQLLEEYMEFMTGDAENIGLGAMLHTTIQSSKAVELFLVSSEEMRARTNMKEDSDYSSLKLQLAAILNDLLAYIQALDSEHIARMQLTEMVLNRLMSMVSVMLRCLVDLDTYLKGNPLSHELPISPRLSTFSQSQHMMGSPVDDPEPGPNYGFYGDPDTADYGSYKDAALPTAITESDAGVTSRTMARNTAPAVPRNRQAGMSVNHVVPMNRKVASLNVLSERHKKNAQGPFSPDKDPQRIGPAYGEAHDLEKTQNNFYRTNHDSAVDILSNRNTPHQSLLTGHPLIRTAPVNYEDEPNKRGFAATEDSPVNTVEAAQMDVERVKDAERKIKTIFMLPSTEKSHIAHVSSVDDLSDSVHPLTIPQSCDSNRDDDAMAAPPCPDIPSTETNAASSSAQPARSPRIGAGSNTNAGETRSHPIVPQVPRGGHGLAIMHDDQFLSVEGRVSTSSELAPPTANSSPRAQHSPVLTPQTSRPISRSPGVTRTRSPIPPSPKLDSSRRMPRPDYSSNASSPSLGSEARFERPGTSNSSLSPAMTGRPRRGSNTSVNSTRSDMSTVRRAGGESRPSRDHSSGQDARDRRPSSSMAGSRNHPRSPAATPVRTDPAAGREEEMLSVVSTPTTPSIQTFENGLRRPSKSQRRESVQSTMSSLTITSQHSAPVRGYNSQRPLSPSPHLRANHTEAGGRGRLSSESSHSSEKQRQAHLPPSQQQQRATVAAAAVPPPSLRQRQNKVGHHQAMKGRTSFEYRPEPTPSSPWFLEHDYEPDEVLYDDDKQLLAATLDAYIEILTSHKAAPDASFVLTFYTTFRMFVSPVELTNLLIQRFIKKPSPDLTEQEVMIWKMQKQDRIQKRVHFALKTWLDGYWVSEKDRDAFKLIIEFVTREMMEALPGLAGRLLDMLNQWANKRRSLCLDGRPPAIGKARSCDRINQLNQEGNSPSGISGSGSATSSPVTKPYATVKDRSYADPTKSSVRKGIIASSAGRDSSQSKGPPVPLVNKTLLNQLSNEQTMCNVPVTEIKPVEMARQLTMIMAKLYYDIHYLELLSKEKPNVSRMVVTTDKLSCWMAESILDETDVKKRISLVKFWIDVGEECLRLNNFDTLIAVCWAIDSTAVARLHNTWEGIGKSYTERSSQMLKLMSAEKNHSAYRAKLKAAKAPCVPFIGLYKKALTYVDDGNSIYKEVNPPLPTGSSKLLSQQQPSTPVPVANRRLLRFGRFHKFAKIVQEFRDFQGPYELLEVPRLRDYILKSIENIVCADLDRRHRMSLALEPNRPSTGNFGGFGGGGIGGNSNYRASQGTRGFFHGGISNSDVNAGGGNVFVKPNKLSFFRKSGRS